MVCRAVSLKRSNTERHPSERYAALISRILNFIEPRGAATSTVSPFFLPMIALPTGDSFESLFSAGVASGGPTVRWLEDWLGAILRRGSLVTVEAGALGAALLT